MKTYTEDEVRMMLVIAGLSTDEAESLLVNKLEYREAQNLRGELERARRRIKELEDMVDDTFGGRKNENVRVPKTTLLNEIPIKVIKP
jgi:hypothetical protein